MRQRIGVAGNCARGALFDGVQVSRADQQIPCAVLLDTHQSRAARNLRELEAKTISPLFSITCRDSARSRPRLAWRSQHRSSSRCSNVNPTQHPYTHFLGEMKC